MEKFGDFVVTKRKETGLSIRGMAKKVGVSPTFLCDIESNDRAFPASSKKDDLAQKFMDALELTDAERATFAKLADESALSKNRISQETIDYLKSAPIAQQALRKAKDVNATDDDWEKFLKSLDKKDK